MGLNKDQQKAVEFINNWWKCNQLYLVIDAKAGTGKTYTINHVLKKLPNCSPLLLCPTNEALDQLRDKLDSPDDYVLKTVDSALGITPVTDSKDLEFEHVAIPSLWDNFNLAILDECSMVDDFHLNLLRSIGIKIIFVGHSSQLPPVVKKRSLRDKCISPVFAQGWETITLTKPMRNTGDLWGFNNHVEGLIYKPDLLQGTYDIKKMKLESYLRSETGKRDFLSGKTKIVAWTNAGVDKLNNQLRDIIHGDKARKNKYLLGDKIIITNPYIVTEIENLSEQKLLGLKRENEEILYSNAKATVIASKIVTIRLNKYLSFPCYKTEVKHKGRRYFFYSVAYPSDYKKIEDHYEQKAWGMKSKQAKVKAYRERRTLLSCFANIKHYFAATSHRLQGTSIPKIIVMYNDIVKNPNRVERAKCLYVATSRCIDELMVYRGH